MQTRNIKNANRSKERDGQRRIQTETQQAENKVQTKCTKRKKHDYKMQTMCARIANKTSLQSTDVC